MTSQDSLKWFAAEINRIAGIVHQTHGHSGRVFIHNVFSLYLVTVEEIDRAEFEGWLWAATQAGLVVLSRCDMVEAFSPMSVRLSNMRVNGATFNFIRV